jgi:Right handed beta helix region
VRPLVRAIATVSALALLGASGIVRPASAAVVTCGQTITQSTVLDADVGPCPANNAHGIIVGADNVTLDLNGHTVFGAVGGAAGEGAGVYVFRRTGVTVRNGTVRDFDGGVVIEGGAANTVTGITARDNIGIVGVTRYAEGIAILSSADNRIVANTVYHNGPLAGIGIYTVINAEHQRTTSGVSRGNLISRNLVVDNNLPRSQVINDSDGIRVETQSVFNTISGNRVTGSGLDGIALLSFAPDNTITGNFSSGNGFLNTFRRRGDGIRVFGGSNRTTVTFNQTIGNAANGIIFHGVFGTRVPVTNSRATDNMAVNNSRLPPIEQSELGGPTFDLLDGNPNCDANVWLRNRFRTASPPCTTTAGTPV